MTSAKNVAATKKNAVLEYVFGISRWESIVSFLYCLMQSSFFLRVSWNVDTSSLSSNFLFNLCRSPVARAAKLLISTQSNDSDDQVQ